MFLKAIEQKRKRYEELHRLLADHDVIANKAEYQALVKELSGLTPIVSEYDIYLKAVKDISDLEHVLADKTHDKEFLVMADDEKRRLEKRVKELHSKLEDILLEGDDEGNRNIIMEIRAGTGGTEASLFVADLLRMYSKYAIARGWKVEPIDSSTTEKGGFKEVIFSISGLGVYERLKFESGTHRVQRVPETEASGRIHTSAATVAVLPEAKDIDVEIRSEDIRIDVYRSGGAGGQGVNRTDSAVRLTYIPTGMIVTCQDGRSQLKNKAKAMGVLRARLLDEREKAQSDSITKTRRAQVGSGDRSEKIRTYNYPDRRVTDHRIGYTAHNLEGILEGDLEDLIQALRQEERKVKLQALK